MEQPWLLDEVQPNEKPVQGRSGYAAVHSAHMQPHRSDVGRADHKLKIHFTCNARKCFCRRFADVLVVRCRSHTVRVVEETGYRYRIAGAVRHC